jgi:hypothetical protein
MYCISDEQIDFILTDIRRRGIKIESLQFDLLDHICILIEQGLEENGDFGQFYAATLKTFYRQELREIEEETLFLAASKNRLVLTRTQFFGLLFLLFIGPFVGYDLTWLDRSGQASGWSIPFDVWGGTLVFSLFPLLVLLVLLLTPERFDPVIPRKSRILVGIKPFIRIIHA